MREGGRVGHPWAPFAVLSWAALSVLLSAFCYPSRLGGWFDAFRFTLWLVLPAAIARWACGATRESLGLVAGRPKRGQILAFGAFLLLATVLLLWAMRQPSLQSYYGSTAQAMKRMGWSWFLPHLGYTLSWMLGWEFMLRGLVLNHGAPGHPRRAVAWVLLLDLAAHVHKSPLECGGILLLAPIQIWLVRRTGSLLWPILLHLWVECAYPLVLWGL